MELTKGQHALRYATLSVVALWLLLQFVVIIYRWDTPFYSDPRNYVTFASEACEAGAWYPTQTQMAENRWIANTGYINLLVANLYLFGSVTPVIFEQLALNCLLLFSLWKLARRFGGERIGMFTVILFCMLPSNILSVTPLMSDLPCMALLMASIVMMRRNWAWLFVAGAVVALANWMRPIGMIYWPSIFIVGLLLWPRGERKGLFVKYAVVYVAGIMVVNGAVMTLTYSSSGVALAGSTTKGTNMIMGCNDLADGGYNDVVFNPGGVGYIESDELNAVGRDKELTRRSVEWIIANPGRFVALMPAKIFRLWCGDYYNNKCYSPGGEKDSMKSIFLWSVTYYLTLLLALAGIWSRRRNLWGIDGCILLPVILGTGMQLLMYGGMRYHYPMMPSLIYFASVALSDMTMRAKSLKTS